MILIGKSPPHQKVFAFFGGKNLAEI